MELRHLRYFRAVAEELHFGRAAQRLHIAQPPLSQQIRQLERELGVDLLVRSTRKVELTPAGAAYLRRAVAILDAADDAAELARRVSDGLEGRLVIGCVGSATYSLLPRLVRALGEELPAVEVSVRGEMLAAAQIRGLLDAAIDIALMRPPVAEPGVRLETIRHDRVIAVLPTDHPLTSHAALRVSELKDEAFIAHSGRGRSVMNGLLHTLCAEAGFVPRIRHEVEETATLVTLVAAGLGVAIVPAPTAALSVSGVCYRSLGPDVPGVDLAVGRLATTDSPLIERSLSVLRGVVAEVHQGDGAPDQLPLG